jgi:hypothetical protein
MAYVVYSIFMKKLASVINENLSETEKCSDLTGFHYKHIFLCCLHRLRKFILLARRSNSNIGCEAEIMVFVDAHRSLADLFCTVLLFYGGH